MAVSAKIIRITPTIPAEPKPSEKIDARITRLTPSIPAEPEIISAKITSISPEIPEEPKEETFPEKLARLITSSLPGAAVFIEGLSQENINLVLESLLKRDDGETLIEKLGMYGFDQLVKEAPEYEVLRRSPKGSISIAVILGIISLILGIGTVVGWLRKEAPEPSGMAVWAMIEAKNWEAANEANQQYIKFINSMNGWLPTAISWFNPFLAAFLKANKESQLAGAAAYQKVIDENLAKKIGHLKVTCNISGADVYIDGIKKGIVPYEVDLEAMSYHILVGKFQFTNYEEDALIRENETTEVSAVINPIIQPSTEKAKLQITVDPADAVISVAGVPEISASGNYEVDPGTYTIKAAKEGYYEKSATAIAKAGELTVVSMILNEIPPPEEEAPGILVITAIPEDILIEVAGIPSINQPGQYELPPGTYTIKAAKEGYYDKYSTAYIKSGERFVIAFTLSEVQAAEIPTTEVTVPLEQKGPYYNAWKYSIKAIDKETGETIYAKIYVDGVDIGHYTPWSIYLQPESRYILRLEKYGYYPAEVEINTNPLPI